MKNLNRRGHSKSFTPRALIFLLAFAALLLTASQSWAATYTLTNSSVTTTGGNAGTIIGGGLTFSAPLYIDSTAIGTFGFDIPFSLAISANQGEQYSITTAMLVDSSSNSFIAPLTVTPTTPVPVTIDASGSGVINGTLALISPPGIDFSQYPGGVRVVLTISDAVQIPVPVTLNLDLTPTLVSINAPGVGIKLNKDHTGASYPLVQVVAGVTPVTSFAFTSPVLSSNTSGATVAANGDIFGTGVSGILWDGAHSLYATVADAPYEEQIDTFAFTYSGLKIDEPNGRTGVDVIGTTTRSAFPAVTLSEQYMEVNPSSVYLQLGRDVSEMLTRHYIDMDDYTGSQTGLFKIATKDDGSDAKDIFVVEPESDITVSISLPGMLPDNAYMLMFSGIPQKKIDPMGLKLFAYSQTGDFVASTDFTVEIGDPLPSYLVELPSFSRGIVQNVSFDIAKEIKIYDAETMKRARPAVSSANVQVVTPREHWGVELSVDLTVPTAPAVRAWGKATSGMTEIYNVALDIPSADVAYLYEETSVHLTPGGQGVNIDPYWRIIPIGEPADVTFNLLPAPETLKLSALDLALQMPYESITKQFPASWNGLTYTLDAENATMRVTGTPLRTIEYDYNTNNPNLHTLIAQDKATGNELNSEYFRFYMISPGYQDGTALITASATLTADGEPQTKLPVGRAGRIEVPLASGVESLSVIMSAPDGERLPLPELVLPQAARAALVSGDGYILADDSLNVTYTPKVQGEHTLYVYYYSMMDDTFYRQALIVPAGEGTYNPGGSGGGGGGCGVGAGAFALLALGAALTKRRGK